MSLPQTERSGRVGPRLAVAGMAVLGAAALSGLPLAFAVRPVPEWVRADLLDLQQASPLAFVHALHGWLAQGAVVFTWGAVLWLVARGIYRTEQRPLWWGALALLLAVTAWTLTGRLLRWDDVAQTWLATLIANESGMTADRSGGRSLLAVWVGHCVLLPAFVGLALEWVRRALGRARQGRG